MLADTAQKDCGSVTRALAEASAVADNAGWSKAFALSAAEAITAYPVLLCAAPKGSATATAIVRGECCMLRSVVCGGVTVLEEW